MPNLPGVRRDIASVNPKLYKRFTESRKSANPESRELGMSDSFEEGSFTSLFDDPERLAEFNKSITPFPEKAEAYNDPNGRYSLVSQRNDRLNKSRSLPYMSLEGLPSFVTNDTTVCSYSAYFLEKGDGETVSARKVQMKLFLEDNSIQIIEPKVENSGIFQGKFLKRHQIFKPTTRIPSGNNSGTLMYTISDFYAGAELDIYNRIYTIVDCDLATKMHYTKLGLTFGTPISYPDNVYDPSRRPGLSSSSMRTTKTKARAKLGYFEYDRKVLRFFGVWDSRGMLFGDQLHVRVHYYLADDTMEIIPIPSRNNGRDKLAKFVKKSKILKPLMQTMAPSFSSVSSTSSLVSTSRSMLNQIAAVPPDPSEYYHWKDLKIGEVISVAALDVLLIDADEFTREFYNSKNMTLGMPIVLPEPVYPSVETTIPPYNGFGSKEDSLATCKNTLMPAPTLKDGLKAKIFQGMILRYEATFSNPKV